MSRGKTDHVGNAYYHVPITGFARLPDVIGDRRNGIPPFIPVSRTEWFRGIQQGRFPQGLKLGVKTRVWTWESLHTLKRRIESANVSGEFGGEL